MICETGMKKLLDDRLRRTRELSLFVARAGNFSIDLTLTTE